MSTIKVWNGSSWGTTNPTVWNGSSWVPAYVSAWDGAAWGSVGTPAPGSAIDLHTVTVGIQGFGSGYGAYGIYGYGTTTPSLVGSISAGSPNIYTITDAYWHSSYWISITITGAPTTWSSVTIGGSTPLLRSAATLSVETWTWYGAANAFGTTVGATKLLSFLA